MTTAPVPLLELRDASIRYPGAEAAAVSGVSLELRAGEIVGLVGESGCGKSSTARALLGLVPLAGGELRLRGEQVDPTSAAVRTAVQAIFQNPSASFNPKRSLLDSVAEPLRINRLGSRAERRAAALEVLERVGIDERTAQQRPHQVSGGQCQRAAIARAVIRRPEILVCDEPVSALDVSIQAQILHLLMELRSEFGLAMLFISHDLSVVANLCDRTAVMYAGRVVEQGPSLELAHRPQHPYADHLRRSRPSLDRVAPEPLVARGADRAPGTGSIEEVDGRLLSGCSYHLGCPRAVELCRSQRPHLRTSVVGHEVACHEPLPAPTT